MLRIDNLQLSTEGKEILRGTRTQAVIRQSRILDYPSRRITPEITCISGVTLMQLLVLMKVIDEV